MRLGAQVSILGPGISLQHTSARHESPVGTNLQPQFFAKRLAFLEALEELFKDADHNRIHADAFGLGPLLELEPGFGADVEELRVGKLHAGLAGLHDFYFFAFNVAQSKKDDPGQIALYARLFGDCFTQINGEAQRHSRTVVRPPLPLAVDFPHCLLCCFLHYHLLPFPDSARNLAPHRIHSPRSLANTDR